MTLNSSLIASPFSNEVHVSLKLIPTDKWVLNSMQEEQKVLEHVVLSISEWEPSHVHCNMP